MSAWPENDQFFNRIIPEPMSGCWLWLGSVASKGYGQFRGQMAHRFSYERDKGSIPVGMVIDHLCRNTACVNPEHLEPVTSRENTMRGVGVASANAAKTHCLNGHEFTDANTRLKLRDGMIRRECKDCQRERVRAYRSKNTQSQEMSRG